MFAQKKKSLISGKTFVVIVIILLAAGYFINTTQFGKKEEQNLRAMGADQASEPADAAQLKEADSEAQPGVIQAKTQLLMRINDQITNTTKTQELLMPSEAIGKTFEKAEPILLSRYKDSLLREINESYVLLYKVIEKTEKNGIQATSAPNSEDAHNQETTRFYMIKEDEGIIKVYQGDEDGSLELMRETQINIDFLSSVDQELFRYGVIKHSMDEVNELLQDFES